MAEDVLHRRISATQRVWEYASRASARWQATHARGLAHPDWPGMVCWATCVRREKSGRWSVVARYTTGDLDRDNSNEMRAYEQWKSRLHTERRAAHG